MKHIHKWILARYEPMDVIGSVHMGMIVVPATSHFVCECGEFKIFRDGEKND